MEEKVKDKEIVTEIPPLGKKYIIIWRNKWITSNAGSIDDFIAIYGEITEKMKRWKKEGIGIDPDIIGGIGGSCPKIN